jgi:hypothetical protein
MRIMRYFRFVLGCLLLLSALTSHAAEPDWSLYGDLLAKYVSEGTVHGVKLNVVNYAGLKSNGELEAVAVQLSVYPLEKLVTREEKLAFYINTYNVLAMKMVADNLPVKSIRDIGSLVSPIWKKPAGMLGGKSVTLDVLEHKVLRPLGEPRVHFAIVCASVSCPDLRAEPYAAARLNEQLDAQAQAFLANPAKGLREDGGYIRVSRIFDWFEKDFDVAGGVESFIRHHFPGLPRLPVKADIPYDWSLNSRAVAYSHADSG